MGIVEGNKPAGDNEWEQVTRGGAAAIERWIDSELYGKSCNVVLIGANTAGRKWINYEIKRAWNSKKGVLGVYVHRLKDLNGYQSSRGSNPFDYFLLDGSDRKLSTVVSAYNPPYANSKDAYAYIHDNLFDWIEQAIQIREDEG
jgi:MTH538 TIR-like domain (DUF1863)